MKKNNFLVCNLTLFTNFNPFFFKTLKINFKIKKKQKIFCKNFLFFFILLKFFKKHSNINVSNIFVKPKKKSLITLLRPPYKNKLSRHQITNNRFFLNFKLKTPIKISNNINIEILKKNIFFFKSFFSFFETNLLYQHKIKFYFKFNNSSNFLLTN